MADKTQAEAPPPGPPAMVDPFASPTPESAHKDCPPAVWDGLRWVCGNHQPAQFVAKTRAAFVKQEGTRAPRPSPMHGTHGGSASVDGAMQERDALAKRVEELATEGARLKSALDQSTAEVASKDEAITKLRKELQAAKRAAKK